MAEIGFFCWIKIKVCYALPPHKNIWDPGIVPLGSVFRVPFEVVNNIIFQIAMKSTITILSLSAAAVAVLGRQPTPWEARTGGQYYLVGPNKFKISIGQTIQCNDRRNGAFPRGIYRFLGFEDESYDKADPYRETIPRTRGYGVMLVHKYENWDAAKSWNSMEAGNGHQILAYSECSTADFKDVLPDHPIQRNERSDPSQDYEQVHNELRASLTLAA